MTDLRDWFNSIPLVTRYWFGASVIVPLLGRFGLLNAMWMYLDWELFIYKFHFWRPFTALVFYPVTPMTGFHWLLMLYFLYNYSKSTEEGTFSGRPADYLFMLIVNWLICTGLCMAIGIPFLLEPMVLSVLYVWCQLNKDTIVSFWFGTRFKAMYLPWILWGFNMVLRGGGINELLGILVGHTYYFLAFRYPQEHGGGMFLVTPQFLRNWLPNEVGGVHGFGQSTVDARRRAQAAGGRDGHNWGAGHQLGGDN
ncbi:hypothetical protein WR25_21987 [Diploscapter pachys]|uniref:Derlin n=1 Tax=Diploscapter pachys TaxID=2018661 RepID=A0A2A2L9S7_9BILA|nr:hypothetical protein WR25_21987 [Diploscapter pachys]